MICDYEGSDYKTRFWQNADRAYEDAVERVAIRRLLPPKGQRVIEFGAGFGRLADLYTGYDEIMLLDYSRSLLEQAQEQWGSDPRFKFVAADIISLAICRGRIERGDDDSRDSSHRQCACGAEADSSGPGPRWHVCAGVCQQAKFESDGPLTPWANKAGVRMRQSQSSSSNSTSIFIRVGCLSS